MRVHGIGPIPCEFLVCGESPGYNEAQCGRPFVGRIGQELDRFLDGVDLPHRNEVYLTNLYREYGGKDYQFTAADLERDEPALLREIALVQPKIIITLGAHSTRWFLNEDVHLDEVWGYPWKIEGGYVVFPIYHPASGFHSPELSSKVVAGFQALSSYLDGQIEPRVLYDDPFAGVEQYVEITDPKDIEIDPRQNIFIDTEGYPHAPWSLQYSQVPGEGYLIAAKELETIRRFGEILRQSYPQEGPAQIVFHSALHELPMLRAMGIETNDLNFGDTMVMAYLLQVEPQGLKPLATRHCNMKMQSFDEIMGDVGTRLAIDHLMALYDLERLDHEQRCREEFERRKTEVWTDKRGVQRVGRRIRKIPSLPKITPYKAVERTLRSDEPRKLWFKDDEAHELIRDAGDNRVGPMPEGTLDYVERPRAIHYGCRDSDATCRVQRALYSRIRTLGLDSVYTLEMGTYPLIDRMREIGIRPDLDHFAKLSERLATELGDIQSRLDEPVTFIRGDAQSGTIGFNANSGDQVAALLFDELNLEGGKRTSNGNRYSTNDKILESLEREYPEHEVIGAIREFREVYKLKNTFVDRLPRFVNRWPYDGRIHCTYRTTRVVSGRLAASEPNLLAMPKHGKFAKDFRRGFIPRDGWVFGSWDLSQIELRIGAHLSQDLYMLAIYRGEVRNPDGSRIDLHAALAERIFGVKPKYQDNSKHRLPAKAINFGFWMGQTNFGLAVELRKNGMQVDEDDAQRWIDEANKVYKGAQDYKQRMIAEAKRNGYIRCMSGRIRYIGGIHSKDDRVKAEAERFAYSTPIQEGAQLITKTAETLIWQEIVKYQKQGYGIEPITQIHDDILLELEPRMLPVANEFMVRCLTKETAHLLSVPIETSGDTGSTWADMKAINYA